MGIPRVHDSMIIDLVFPWSKREYKEYVQYKHKKHAKNNIFIEFYQLVNKHCYFRERLGVRKQRDRWDAGNNFLKVNPRLCRGTHKV